MICKNCQHNNPEPNRFCGMCGQPLFRPQSNARSTTTTPAPVVNNAQQTSYLSSRETPPPVTTLPPVGTRAQSTAPVSAEKKVQFPPVAPPPASRAAAPAAGTPTAPQAGARANGTPAPAERPASAAPSPTAAAQPISAQSPTGVLERRGPFPKTPLGPQAVTATGGLDGEKPGSDNKMQTPGRAATPLPATPPPVESRVQNQAPYSQVSDMKPWTPEAANKAASEKPMATGAPAAERRTQPPASSQHPAAAVTPPAKKAPASTQIRVAGPSFLGLSDDPMEVTPKDREYDDLYKTHWGGRIAIVFVILGIAGGLVYLQWRSGHSLRAAAAPKPPTAARVDNTSESSTADPSAAATTNPTNPPAAASQGTNRAPANGRSTANNPAGNAQLPNGSNQTPINVSAPAVPAAKAAAPAANGAKAASPADAIREGHEIAAKSQEDLEEPVRLAENYIQGRGVAQNCNAALGILRNASDRGNPRAEIKLGALYATGNCVAPDRVAAYRHFSRAIASQPNNVYLEESRSRLWKDMTDAERKQAMEVEK